MNTHDHRKLFSPVQIGPITLGHRVVMAPLTRSRSQQPGDIPNDLMREYYTQRASEGGFIVTEATNISITGRGWLGAPGMYSDQQVEGWKKITAAVRAKFATVSRLDQTAPYEQKFHLDRPSKPGFSKYMVS